MREGGGEETSKVRDQSGSVVRPRRDNYGATLPCRNPMPKINGCARWKAGPSLPPWRDVIFLIEEGEVWRSLAACD